MKFILLLPFLAFGFSKTAPIEEVSAPVVIGDACKSRVHNRGRPPEWFLSELVAWGKTAPAKHFEATQNYDIYSSVKPELGPYKSDKHRRAVMLEVLRVLGGFESSWRHTVGRDITNQNSMPNGCGEEAGIFQTSQNATYFGADLKFMQIDQCKNYTQKTICLNFIACSKDSPGNKANRKFVYDFTSLLLRRTVNHHGPVKRKEINKWLSRSCVAEIESKL